MTGIIGAGFGLYGHLPAAMSLSNNPVFLPKRYAELFHKRTELAVFEDRINWVEDEIELF